MMWIMSFWWKSSFKKCTHVKFFHSNKNKQWQIKTPSSSGHWICTSSRVKCPLFKRARWNRNANYICTLDCWTHLRHKDPPSPLLWSLSLEECLSLVNMHSSQLGLTDGFLMWWYSARSPSVSIVHHLFNVHVRTRKTTWLQCRCCQSLEKQHPQSA